MAVEVDAVVEMAIGETTWQAEVASRDRTISRHTGRELALLEVTFVGGEDEDELIADLAAEARKGRLRSAQDPLRRWRLKGSSFGYTDGPRQHRWQLEEVEGLQPDLVVVEGLELRPRRYHEAFVGERLEIDLRTTLSADEVTRVQDLWLAGEPVTVTRSGISAEPRSMDLGWGPWSEMEGGGAKVEFSLTDSEPQRKPGAFQPLMWNLRLAAGRARAGQDALISLLVAKGLITAEEAAALEAEARAKGPRTSMRLMLVEDLDSWRWDHDQNEAQE